jgi:hypothetical protein
VLGAVFEVSNTLGAGSLETSTSVRRSTNSAWKKRLSGVAADGAAGTSAAGFP